MVGNPLNWNIEVMSNGFKAALFIGAAAVGTSAFVAPAFAACAILPAGAPVVRPGDLLGRFPNGGGAMVSEVRNMVATNPSSIDGIPAILDAANAEQKRAIGAGLGQATKLCASGEPDSARRIQEAVLKMNKDVVLSFEVVTGDRQTAATGGGPGGGGGGGGGGTGISGSSTANGSNSYIAPSTSSFANSGSSFSSGSGGFAGLTTGRSVSITTTGTTTTTSPAAALSSSLSTVTSPDATVSRSR